MKRTIRILLLLFSLLLISTIVTLIIHFAFDNKEPTIGSQPTNIYDETFAVAADKDFDPYSFFDENGTPTGHDIEMIYLLADAMKMNVEIRLMEWNKAIEATKNKEVDILLGLVYTPQKSQDLQLSIPISNDAFVVFGKKDYEGLNALYDKKIAILKGSDISTIFLKPYRLEENTTAYDTYGEAFLSVKNGQNDYVIATYSVGRRLSAQHKDILPFGSALVSNSFSIAVAGDNVDLADKINETILEKKSDGSLDALSEKWLGKYVGIISITDFIKQHTALFIVLLFFIFFTPLVFLIYVYRSRSMHLKQNESRLLERASRDCLTNLLNRGASESIINQIISETEAEKDMHALFMIDIDNFKDINDTHGHIFGDYVLGMIAEDIKKEFRDNDVVARMGGDEFLVFMKHFKNVATLVHKASNVCAALNKNKTIQGTNIRISASVGISLCSKDGSEFKSLYKNADKALYAAKAKGKNQFVFYSTG